MELKAIKQRSPNRGLQPARVSKGSKCYNHLLKVFTRGIYFILESFRSVSGKYLFEHKDRLRRSW